MNFYLYLNASPHQTLSKNSSHTENIHIFICIEMNFIYVMLNYNSIYELSKNSVLNNQILNVNLEGIGLIFPDVSPEPIIKILIPIFIGIIGILLLQFPRTN